MRKRFAKPASRLLLSWSRASLVILFATSSVSCLNAPELTIETPEGRAAILRAAQNALSSGLCGQALNLLEDLYDSEYADNRVRLVYASAHGCVAQIDFFSLIQDIIDNAEGFAGLTFWTTVTALFEPESTATTTDIERRMYASWQAYDAAMAALQVGKEIPSQYLINTSGYNPASLLAADRIDDANFFVFLDSLAVVSHTHYTYGDPSSDNEQQSSLPWLESASMSGSDLESEAGCAYAGSLVHLLDSIEQISDSLSGSTVSSALDNIASFLRDGTGPFPGISDSCLYGCQGLDIDGITPYGADAVDCPYTVAECHSCPASDPDCITCPIALRDRSSCQSDPIARCAAAGIVRFMDTTWQDN